MKKNLFLSILALGLLVCFTTNAQTENTHTAQGKFALGASTQLGFSSTNFDAVDDNMNSFNFEVSGGYFFIDNLMFGAGLGYSSMKWGDLIDSDQTTWGLFGRYYIQGFFGGAGYYSTKVDDDDAINAIGFEAGYAIFLNDFLSIEPSLIYQLGTGDNESNTFGAQIGFGIYL